MRDDMFIQFKVHFYIKKRIFCSFENFLQSEFKFIYGDYTKL